MHKEPLHTRFRIAPSGDVHVGHAILAWLSMQAARVTGGTFTMRTQQIWASRNENLWRKFREFSHRNLDELMALGIEPSHANVFLGHGMSPSWRLQFSDDRSLIDCYWHKLGLDKLWPWQPDDEPCKADVRSMRLRWTRDNEPPHPYIRFAQLVGEVTTGRNCIIRGIDHMRESDVADYFMHLIAKEHYGLEQFDRRARYAPTQHFLQFIRCSSGDGGKLSSSDVTRTEGFFVKDVLEAGVPPERLFLYMCKILWGSVERGQRAWTDWSTEPVLKPTNPEGAPFLNPAIPVQAGVRYLFSEMVERPTIDHEDWRRFLRTWEVE